MTPSRHSDHCLICGQPVNSDRHGYGRHLPEGISREQEKENDSGAELIHQTIPDGAETEPRLSHVEQAIAELDAILRNDRKCFAEDSDTEEFLGRVTNARLALAKIGHPLIGRAPEPASAETKQ